MRLAWLCLALLLAGCAAPAPVDGSDGDPEVSIDAAPEPPTDGGSVDAHENATFEEQTGSIVAEGLAHRACPDGFAAEGLLRREHFLFSVPELAESVHLTFDWSTTNPTTERLEFLVYRDVREPETVQGTTGLTFDLNVSHLGPGERDLTATIGSAACGVVPVAVAYFAGIRVDVEAHFA